MHVFDRSINAYALFQLSACNAVVDAHFAAQQHDFESQVYVM